jgi:hypothetical protein
MPLYTVLMTSFVCLMWGTDGSHLTCIHTCMSAWNWGAHLCYTLFKQWTIMDDFEGHIIAHLLPSVLQLFVLSLLPCCLLLACVSIISLNASVIFYSCAWESVFCTSIQPEHLQIFSGTVCSLLHDSFCVASPVAQTCMLVSSLSHERWHTFSKKIMYSKQQW